MNKNKFVFLSLSLLLLTSCGVELDELYSRGQFESADFTENYYEIFPNELREKVKATYEYDLDDFDPSFHYYGSLNDSNKETATLKYILDTDHALGYESELYERYQQPEERNMLMLYNDYSFRNCLMKTKRNFAYGAFSKLTDGLMYCDGTGPRVSMQLKEEGFGQIFKNELINYSTILMAFRGATNIPSELLPASRSSTVAFNFAFYVADGNQYIQHSFKKICVTNTDAGGANTNLLYINLQKILSTNPQALKRAKGFSLTYELLDHPCLKPEGAPALAAYADYQYAFMFYELMLPHSKWN